MISSRSAEFRFDQLQHDYIELATGRVLPHVTEMLEHAGWIDSRFYTDESRERGHQVHRLSADFDLGAIGPDDVQGKFRSYLLSYVDAMRIIPHRWDAIEEPTVHPSFRFGGRPDRVGRIYTTLGVLEVKTGLVEKAHPIQTALQAILVAPKLGIPPEIVDRFALYVKATGRWKLEQHREPRDLIEARRIIRLCT